MNEVVSWARVLSVLARGISPWARSHAVCAAPASKATAAAVEAAVETARGGSAAAVLAATAAAAVLADICGSHIALCEVLGGARHTEIGCSTIALLHTSLPWAIALCRPRTAAWIRGPSRQRCWTSGEAWMSRCTALRPPCLIPATCSSECVQLMSA